MEQTLKERREPAAGARATAETGKGNSRILFIMCLAVLIAQLDTSVVNLAVPAIGAELGASVSRLQWVVDGYNLVYASLLLTGGTLGDLYGRRRIFASGVAIFTIGSLVCGLAPSNEILIGGRALAGLGAALVMPASLAILAVTYRGMKERARAIGIWAGANGLAFAIGPTLGGLAVDAAGWRSIFLLIVPASVLAFTMALRELDETSSPEGRSLDILGQGLAVIMLGALTLAAIEGPRWGWRSLATISCAAASLVAFLSFVAAESRLRRAALVPLDIFNKELSASMAVAALMTFGMYALLFLAPIYLQSARGGSAFEAGVELLPLSLSFLVVSARSGPLAARFGINRVMGAGMALMGAGLLQFAQVSPGASLTGIELTLLLIGVGLGLNTGPVMAVAVSSAPPERAGTASGLGNTARMVGATLGVALLGALFAERTGQDARSGAHMIEGLRAAFYIGALGEFLGCAVALAFIRPRRGARS